MDLLAYAKKVQIIWQQAASKAEIQDESLGEPLCRLWLRLSDAVSFHLGAQPRRVQSLTE
jgi:hypothetical protein